MSVDYADIVNDPEHPAWGPMTDAFHAMEKEDVDHPARDMISDDEFHAKIEREERELDEAHERADREEKEKRYRLRDALLGLYYTVSEHPFKARDVEICTVRDGELFRCDCRRHLKGVLHATLNNFDSCEVELQAVVDYTLFWLNNRLDQDQPH